MAFDAANASHPSRSHFRKSVSLQDWWLTKPQTDDGRKTIGVSGLSCTSQLFRVERCFSSAPIVKTYDFYELETVDGVSVTLQGYINKEKTLENGFSSEVFDHFVIGFPPYWEEFTTSCPKRGSSDECVSRSNNPAQEDSIEGDGNFNDMNTRTKDCQDKVFSTPHEVISGKPLLETEDEKATLLKNEELKFSGRRTTRSMTKVENNSVMGSMTKVGRVDVPEEESAAARQEITPMTESNSKRKLAFENSCSKMPKTPKSTSFQTPTRTSTNKGSPEGYVNGNVLSVSGKRSRSGRVLLPSLEFWRNQTVLYDVDRQITGVRDVAQSSKDTSEDPKSSKKKAKRR